MYLEIFFLTRGSKLKTGPNRKWSRKQMDTFKKLKYFNSKRTPNFLLNQTCKTSANYWSSRGVTLLYYLRYIIIQLFANISMTLYFLKQQLDLCNKDYQYRVTTHDSRSTFEYNFSRTKCVYIKMVKHLVWVNLIVKKCRTNIITKIYCYCNNLFS